MTQMTCREVDQLWFDGFTFERWLAVERLKATTRLIKKGYGSLNNSHDLRRETEFDGRPRGPRTRMFLNELAGFIKVQSEAYGGKTCGKKGNR